MEAGRSYRSGSVVMTLLGQMKNRIKSVAMRNHVLLMERAQLQPRLAERLLRTPGDAALPPFRATPVRTGGRQAALEAMREESE